MNYNGLKKKAPFNSSQNVLTVLFHFLLERCSSVTSEAFLHSQFIQFWVFVVWVEEGEGEPISVDPK